MHTFQKLVFTPAGAHSATLAIAASRAGAVGVFDAELDTPAAAWHAGLSALVRAGCRGFGVKLAALDAADVQTLTGFAAQGLRWVLLGATAIDRQLPAVRQLRAAGLSVMAEVLAPGWPQVALDDEVDALLLKGNEAGGFVGEDASFILLQKWLGRTASAAVPARRPHARRRGRLPCRGRGRWRARRPGAAARRGASARTCAGPAGQPVGQRDRGRGRWRAWRVLPCAEPPWPCRGEGLRGRWRRAALRTRWPRWWPARSAGTSPRPDCCRWATTSASRRPGASATATWRPCWRPSTKPSTTHIAQVAAQPPIAEGAPLAQALGLRFPIVQGPMTRVSDTAEFAAGGGRRAVRCRWWPSRC